MEGVNIDVVHEGVVRVSEVHRAKGNLFVWIGDASDIQPKRKARDCVAAVDLGTERAQVSLNSTSRGHEVLQHSYTARFTDFFVVSATTELGVFRGQDILPWHDDLVVVGEPTSVKVGVPIVDLVLGVGHTEDGKVFLDGTGSNRSVR